MSDKDFSQDLIKEFTHWSVYIHPNQGYLGRLVLWCKRSDACDLTDATKEEQDELFLILNSLKKALTEAFQTDWFNYSFLGNETRHLHGHFIPRYVKSRTVCGVCFEDKLWGHNWSTDHNFKIEEVVLRTIQNEIKEKLK